MKRTILIGVIVLAMLFGVVAYAWAANDSDSAAVEVNARANAHLTISTDVDTVDFLDIDPGAQTADKPVVVTVWSNKHFDFTSTLSGNVAEMGLGHDLADQEVTTRGETTLPDGVYVNIPWSSDAETLYTAQILYGAVQN